MEIVGKSRTFNGISWDFIEIDRIYWINGEQIWINDDWAVI